MLVPVWGDTILAVTLCAGAPLRLADEVAAQTANVLHHAKSLQSLRLKEMQAHRGSFRGSCGVSNRP